MSENSILMTQAQYARHRNKSSESAAERGEWRTDRAPYQRAIMDALSPSHPCEQVSRASRAAPSLLLYRFGGGASALRRTSPDAKWR